MSALRLALQRLFSLVSGARGRSEEAADPGRAAISKMWGERANALMTEQVPTAWSDSPQVRRLYINPLISGTADTGWLEYVARQYFPTPVGLALSLGCGGGGLERHGFDLQIAREFLGLDVFEGAISLARAEAGKPRKRRIRYEVADLNTLVLPENLYDVVFASQSLHHIAALEHYLEQVRRTLKPGGLFIINEFVGASQFQWPDQQLALANAMLARIPEHYRRSIRGHGLKSQVTRPTVAFMNQMDPTEAIRSAEILPALRERFVQVEVRDFGGTLLQLVLQSLCDEEQALLASGALESDFTLWVMRNTK